MREELNVLEGGEVEKTLDPIFNPAEVENKLVKRTIPVPGNKFINQPIVQPYLEKEQVEVQFAPGQDNILELEPVVRKPEV